MTAGPLGYEWYEDQEDADTLRTDPFRVIEGLLHVIAWRHTEAYECLAPGAFRR